MGEEIKEELAKELAGNPVSVGFSDAKVFDPRPVWHSVKGVEKVWMDMVGKKLGRNAEEDAGIKYAVKKMVSIMDSRLRDAQITADDKVIIEPPQLVNMRTDGFGKQQCDLACGVEEVKSIFGEPQIRVGYLKEQKKLVDVNGKEFA